MAAKSPAKPLLPALQHTANHAFAPIQREFNRLFDELGNGWASLTDVALAPRMDVRDTKAGLEMTLELPGIAQDDIKIAVEDDVLTISGEKKAEKETREDNLRISERSYGSFFRSIVLPRSADPSKIKASMNDGVLKLVVPKTAAAEARTIKIQSAK